MVADGKGVAPELPPLLLLGLIGDNIMRSRSPDLHRFAGELSGLRVSYDLLVPPDLGLDFDVVFERARNSGMRGLNITYPYKELVIERLEIEDPHIGRIGSVNTVVFEPDGPRGFNTDYTGFVAAFRAAFPVASPGSVLMIGAGGVGKAVAFALASLGADRLNIVDSNLPKAKALASAVAEATEGRTQVSAFASVDEVAPEADGIVNCTPVGMVGYPGSPVPDTVFAGMRWAFDAVYTPAETLFRQQAVDAGAEFLSGYELFFHQGIQAFELFTGRSVPDRAALRTRLHGATRNA